MSNAVLDRCALTPEARVLEHVKHSPVVGQRIGAEARDAFGGRVGSEVRQEHRRQPTSLVFVGDRKRDLGRVAPGETVVAADADQVVVQERDERHAVVVVDAREVSDLAIRQRRPVTEESEVHALLGLTREECSMRLGVVRPDGPDVHGTSVRRHRIDLPLRRVPKLTRFDDDQMSGRRCVAHAASLVCGVRVVQASGPSANAIDAKGPWHRHPS